MLLTNKGIFTHTAAKAGSMVFLAQSLGHLHNSKWVRTIESEVKDKDKEKKTH